MAQKDFILKISNISKQYRLGLVGLGSLQDDLKRWWYKLKGEEDPFLSIGDVNDRSKSSESQYVWALKDINFEVERGEVLGIIGKNGAGKSTLLKILSRVTLPTTGEIKSKGRIASLLEVGTGFHPELTGRENIYLNGAILGMTKSEIRRKEIEIIDFSGCERYIDTPVKRYSSGMRVRLAFAVAAFLEPDILVIDEVLAVGDAEFQKKAVGKMKDISKGSGRTVLFVSHNMSAVKSICNRTLVLEHGQIVFKGNTEEAISYYLKGDSELYNYKNYNNKNNNSPYIDLFEFGIKNTNKSFKQPILEDDFIELTSIFDLITETPDRYQITFHVHNDTGETLFSLSSARGMINLISGTNKIKCTFPKSFFIPGEYALSFFLIQDSKLGVFISRDLLRFHVIERKKPLGAFMGKELGYIRPNLKWGKID